MRKRISRKGMVRFEVTGWLIAHLPQLTNVLTPLEDITQCAMEYLFPDHQTTQQVKWGGREARQNLARPFDAEIWAVSCFGQCHVLRLPPSICSMFLLISMTNTLL